MSEIFPSIKNAPHDTKVILDKVAEWKKKAFTLLNSSPVTVAVRKDYLVYQSISEAVRWLQRNSGERKRTCPHCEGTIQSFGSLLV
jgi:hypothetical protein